MKIEIVAEIMLSLLLVGMLIIDIQLVEAGTRTFVVPDIFQKCKNP